IPSEAPVPIPVANHRDRMAIGHAIVFRTDGASDGRAHAEQREVAAGDELAIRRRLDASVYAHVQTNGRIGGEVRDAVLVSGLAVLLIRQVWRDHPESAWIADREPAPHDRVEQAEDSGVRA